jgi:hypothetical protein
MSHLSPWLCEHCQKEFRFYEVKQQVVLDYREKKPITVCAQCYKDLTRAKRIVLVYK